jgi:cell division protein FtsL
VSQPARKIAESAAPPARKTAPSHPTTTSPRSALRARTPAARPRANPPQPRARARRGHHPVFWLFAGAVISVLVVGLVAINALSVQTTYRMQSVQAQVKVLSDRHVQLQEAAASLSSPQRVADWAHEHLMVMPKSGATVILRVPGNGWGSGG